MKTFNTETFLVESCIDLVEIHFNFVESRFNLVESYVDHFGEEVACEDRRFLDGAEETGCREMIMERDILSRYRKVSTRCNVAASSNT